MIRFSVCLYPEEYERLVRLQGQESRSRAIARLLMQEPVTKSAEPPEGKYISGIGVPYIIRHEKEL